MKYCYKCGKELDDDSRFCVRCGVEQPQNNSQNENTSNRQAGGSSGDNGWFKGKDRTSEYDPDDIARNKSYGIVGCIPILFFIPLVACPESRYGKFCANQGLLLLILGAALGVVGSIINGAFSIIKAMLGHWFVFGFALSVANGIISFLLWAIVTVLFVVAFVGACQGKAKELPLIGKLRILDK